jgi:hypothetical protein
MDDWNDREEDIIQHNRNAFNEEYNLTLKNYEYLWCKIENGIGIQWFLRPFGIFMKQYFTKNIPINLEIHNKLLFENISISYITSLTIPEITIKENNIFNGEELIKRLFEVCNYMYDIENIKTNLWYIDENEWENLDEIKNLINSIIEYK